MWNENQEKDLKYWREAMEVHQQAHLIEAGRCDKYHNAIGIPAAILSVVSTGIIMWGFDPKSLHDILNVIISFSVAILVSIQTFFNHSGRAEKHRKTSNECSEIKRYISLCLGSPPKDDRARKATMEEISEKISKTQNNALQVDIKLITRHTVESRTAEKSNYYDENIKESHKSNVNEKTISNSYGEQVMLPSKPANLELSDLPKGFSTWKQ